MDNLIEDWPLTGSGETMFALSDNYVPILNGN